MKKIRISMRITLTAFMFSGCFNMTLGEQAVKEIERVHGASLAQYNAKIVSVEVQSAIEKGDKGEVSATVCYSSDVFGSGRGPCEVLDFTFKKTDKGWKMQGY